MKSDSAFAWKLQEEWIIPLSKAELKAFDELAKELEKSKKVSRAYSTGSGAAIVVGNDD